MKPKRTFATGLVFAAAVGLALGAAVPGVTAAPKRPAAKAPAKRKPAAPKAAPMPAVDEPLPPPPEAAAEPAPVPPADPAAVPPTPSTAGAAPAPPAPATSPAADPASAASAVPADKKPAPGAADLARLRAEYQDLKEALFRSRARRETLDKALLSTQVIASLEWVGSRRFFVKTAEVRLDGVRVWEAGDGQVGDKPIALAPRSVAPGAHVLGVRVEVRPRDNPKLGYVSEQSFALAIPEGKKTTVEITIDEDGDPPSYNPDIEIEVDQE